MIATFTWQPAPGQTSATDPPPASAVVEQDTSVTSGLGPRVVGLPRPRPASVGPRPNVTSSANTWYTVVSNPSSSFALPACNLSASCTLPAGSIYTRANCYVSYTATATPVTVRLDMTNTLSNVSDILIGQGCTAFIQAGALPGGTVTFSNFNWLPQDPGIFGGFQTATDKSTGYVIPVASSEWTKPSPHWYYSLDSNGGAGGAFKVSCTATASVNGTSIGTVSGQKDLKVWAPYYYMSHNAGPTGIYGADVSTGGPNLVPPGMTFTGAVGTPASFVSNNATGSWLFAQIINTNHTQWYSFSPIPLTSGSQGVALDNGWPYASSWSADSTANTSTPHSTNDSPDLLLNSGVNEFQVADTYQMYMMYLPPGNDVQYVPLHRLQWEWNAPIVTYVPVLGWPSGASGSVTVDSDLREDTHPTWSRKYTNQ